MTLVGQTIAFAFFVWFCMKFVWPPVVAAMAERQKKIADGLEAADRADRDLELAQEKVAEQLREAKAQAAAIIEQANKRAGQIVDEAKNQAREESERIKAGAQAEILQEANRAREKLRMDVARLAVTGAERVLQKSVDANAHVDMLAELAAEL